MTTMELTTYHTGVLVPVSALRSDENLGVGEFADIPLFAQWCRASGIDIIQLLPVNDTGDESSPYSALSAFALHPIYLRIADLPELKSMSPKDARSITRELEAIRRAHGADTRIRYHDLRAAKLRVVRRMFSQLTLDASVRSELEQFAAANPWIRTYAAFAVLKARNGERAWKEWPRHRDPDDEMIDAIWFDGELQQDVRFHVWVQMRLEQQFVAAARRAADLGVMLKGDLPILMNEDSADVWAHRSTFITRLRAGAPPDMFTRTGQNWDLPIYDWENLAHTGYRWWKDRLVQAAKFYQAYRIDHVLGFFRVWAIPASNYSGLLGYFFPSETADRQRLHAIGLDDGRIRWLSEPHLTGEEIQGALGEAADGAISLALSRIGDEDLYIFGEAIAGERDIQALNLPDTVKEWLVARYTDRALLRIEGDRFAPTWNFRDCSRFAGLHDHEKHAFESMVGELGIASERIWEDQGRHLLGFMREAATMLPCAEDLGIIPEAVPRVLAELEMLGLRILRWTRQWGKSGQPFVPPTEFPFLTVCAPSVHDTSTMRGWWKEEPDIGAFWASLGLQGPVPEDYDPPTARRVTAAILETSSALCVLQIQDILALVPGLSGGPPDDERVNVPGTVNEVNWNYRVPVGVADLANNSDLIETVRTLVEPRRSRPVP